MFVDYEYNNGQLLISYVDKSGQVKLKYFPWKDPKMFVLTSKSDKDKHPKYHTWDNKPVKEVPIARYPNRFAVYDFMDALPAHEQEAIFEYNEPEIYSIDIETEVIDGFPEPLLAPTRILTIAIVLKDSVLVLGLKELSETQVDRLRTKINDYLVQFGIDYKVKYVSFPSEHDLVHTFFHKLVPKMAVLTGWNFIGFDWIFLVNRARILGIEPRVASVTKKLERPWSKSIGEHGGPKDEELPKHRLIVDMMELYQKWDTTIKIKEAKSLDFVADSILGLPKIHYDGSLQNLYENDFEQYVFYNAIDALLVKHIHQKQRYMDIMFAISTVARIRVQDAYSTVRVSEGTFRGPFREGNIVLLKSTYVPDDELEETKTDDDLSLELKGGWVKEPTHGMAMYTAVDDFASLYPTTERQFNISPETFKGVKISDTECRYEDTVSTIEPDDIVCLNGAVFRSESSITRSVLANIYNDRKRYKGLMLRRKEEILEMEKDLAELQQI